MFGPPPGVHPPVFIVFFVVLCPKTVKPPQKQEPLKSWDHDVPEKKSEKEMDKDAGASSRFNTFLKKKPKCTHSQDKL